jgi:hypothetical protein
MIAGEVVELLYDYTSRLHPHNLHNVAAYHSESIKRYQPLHRK